MKKLKELYNCNYDIEIKGIKINSKEVEKGDLFICTKGVTADRHDYVNDAIEHGAVAIVASKKIDVNVPVIMVEDTNLELPKLCARFFDNPEEKLKIYSVTGTDGKTSVATITQYLLGNKDCGYIGTNGRSCSKFNKETNNTTADSDKLYEYFYDFVNADCKCVMMESSSEAFFRGRLTTMTYDIGAITNITREHLNIHGNFENYIDCKCQQFRQIKKDGYAILNKDDEFFETVKAACTCKHIYTYGKEEKNTLQICDYEILPNKTYITYKYFNKKYKIESPLLGEFNVYNLACAILVAIASGKRIEDIIPNIKNINVSGRLDMLPNLGQNFNIMVDYAHTPNGISNLLKFVHTLNVNRSIVVIGSAGERDFLKRPLMGKTVTDNASYAIFTYEDPRSEDPKDIINMMTKEIEDKSKYEVVVDRSEAIKRAIDIAKENDIVLILGKGNETYEKLKNETIYFNDIEEATKHLKSRLKSEKVKQ
jgi:UDP-N-acetylmuramoyl-L-alanyl-D-glutamate--2,6-diaminopimelate ligase